MQAISYAHHQFPAEIIRHAVWLYLRFTLSYRDVEELLAERGIETSYETSRTRSPGSDLIAVLSSDVQSCKQIIDAAQSR
jgi:hypothetical protein